MKIDPTIEDPVRDTFAAVVDKDPRGIVAALEPLSGEHNPVAVSYGMLVCSYVMNDVYQGNVDLDAVDIMSGHICEDVGEWFDIGTKDEVAAFLLSCANGDQEFPGVDHENLPVLAFVSGGYLLSRYRPDSLRWWEYLDRIWAHAQSSPEPH